MASNAATTINPEEARHFGAMDYRAALHGSVVRVERVSGRELRGSR